MKKRGPAKKKAAPTPKKGKKRGPYKTRTTKVDVGGGEHNNVDGMELFKVENYEGVVISKGFRRTKEFAQMQKIVKALKVKEGFVIKAEWKNYPHVIRRELDLPIVLRVITVEGNDKYRRVVRMM